MAWKWMTVGQLEVLGVDENGFPIQFSDENGTAYGIPHVEGRPRFSSTPYLYDIAEGHVPSHTSYSKLGYNADVGSTEEDIITQGGVYPWLAAGTSMTVQSSSANDTLNGTGVQKVRIGYLDSSYNAAAETLNMAGTAQVPMTATNILRINSIRTTQVGTGMMSAGDVTVQSGGVTYRQIPTGFTRGRGAVYTVPLGKTLYLTSIAVSSGFTVAGKLVRWIARAQVDDLFPTVRIPFFMPFFEIQTEDTSFYRQFEIPVRIPATADIKVSATSNIAGSNCSCALRGWLE